MNKPELINEIKNETGCQKKIISEIVDSMLEIIMDKLESGDEIKLKNFGTFRVESTARRMGHNFDSNGFLVIPESKKPVFRPAKLFKRKIGG